jgi:hypothetical protein
MRWVFVSKYSRTSAAVASSSLLLFQAAAVRSDGHLWEIGGKKS